jgi:hypothetical protein
VINIPDYWSGKGPFRGLGANSVKENYSWVVKSKSCPRGIRLTESESNYQINVELKFELSRLWRDEPARRLELVRYIVSTWGGIKRNSQDTLTQYSRLQPSVTPLPLKGVASYSKVLGIIDPDEYAIYDARVAVALNAVQLLAGVSKGYFFPYLPGRNNIVGNSNTKRGFSQDSRFKWGSALFDGWTLVETDEAYLRYLEALKVVSKSEGFPIYTLEMALFSDAEELAIRCFNDPLLLERKM